MVEIRIMIEILGTLVVLSKQAPSIASMRKLAKHVLRSELGPGVIEAQPQRFHLVSIIPLRSMGGGSGVSLRLLFKLWEMILLGS